MALKRITTKDGEVYFVDAKTGKKVAVNPRYTTGNNISGQAISCPKCGELVKRGGFRGWQILLSIFLFPIGLLFLLAGREPSRCTKCGHSWIA